MDAARGVADSGQVRRQVFVVGGLIAAGTFVGIGSTHRFDGGRSPLDGISRGYQSLTFDQSLRTDLLQDIAGARALATDRPTYRPLKQETAELGRPWAVKAPSAHPPTAFLLTLPIAFLPLAWAISMWAVLMLVCLVITFRALGRSWLESVCLVPVALFWPPIAWSLGQFTIPVALGLALAWKYRHNAGMSAAGVALAASVKVLPVVALPLAIRSDRRNGLATFVLLGVVAVGAVLVLNPEAVLRFVTIARLGSGGISRADNVSVAAALTTSRLAAMLMDVALIGLMFPALRSSEDSVRWAAAAWLSVALLPVAWIYSLVPLAGVAAVVLSKRQPLPVLLVTGAVTITFVAAPFGPSGWPLAAATLLAGCGLGFSAASATRHREDCQARGVVGVQSDSGGSDEGSDAGRW